MDTTKEYIKMCEKADEIQKIWSTDIGDYFFDQSKRILITVDCYRNSSFFIVEVIVDQIIKL